jgi:parvulin-like peptidyl-prolyl isomerase
MRIAITTLLALFAGAGGYAYGRHAAATSPLAVPVADGPAIARYRDGAVPRAEVEAEIAKQPDVLRAALRAPGARKTFTEGIVRSEVFAHEAERQGLQKDPEFVRRYREVLGRFYVERTFEAPQKKAAPTDDEVRAFFEANRKALGRPDRVRVAVVSYAAPEGDASRPARRAKAEAALAKLRTKNDAATFAALARTESDDPATRLTNGELPFGTRDELAARLGAEVADAAFALQGGDGLVPRVVETPRAFLVVKVLGHEQGYEPALEEVRDQIRSRLATERRATAYQAFLDRTWKEAEVVGDEKAVAELHVD